MPRLRKPPKREFRRSMQRDELIRPLDDSKVDLLGITKAKMKKAKAEAENTAS